MLTIYRRHKRHCEHRGKGRKYRRCKCPIWVDGFLDGAEIRKSLGLLDWEKAQDKVRKWEAEGGQTSEPDKCEPITLEQVWSQFLADVEARKLHPSTIGKYRLLSRQMQEFGRRRGMRLLSELDLNTVSAFRAEWHDGPLSSAKKLERLRAFFRFAQKRKWMEENPASDLKAPKVSLRPTMPFTQDEMVRILAAIDLYAGRTTPSGRVNVRRLRGLVLLLRYSGMRIGDAVGLSSDRITGDRLFLYTQKTGVPVYTVLPHFVVRELEAAPQVTEKYLFWSGKGRLESAVRSWQTRLRNLFRFAKMPDGHAHRFRDTFAVELLLAGVPIERVSILLGHQSVKITEKHYNPWVRSRQEQLEADVASAWTREPIVLAETKGTPEVHGNTERVN